MWVPSVSAAQATKVFVIPRVSTHWGEAWMKFFIKFLVIQLPKHATYTSICKPADVFLDKLATYIENIQVPYLDMHNSHGTLSFQSIQFEATRDGS